MRDWIARHAVFSFYIIAVTLTWVYWLILLVQGTRVEPGSSATHLPGLLGPALAAVIVTAIVEGSSGLKELLARCIQLRPPRKAKLLLAISPLALGVVTFIFMPFFGRSLPTLEAFAHYPGLPQSWPLAFIVFASLVVNGYGEEIGWRGFMTERLIPRYGWFRTTLLVTVLWAIWHIPVFWLNTNMTSLVGPQLIGWAFGLLCGAFVLAHVYQLSNHSILSVALWHTAYNMMVATEAGQGLPAAIVTTIVMVWGVIVAIRWWYVPPAVP